MTPIQRAISYCLSLTSFRTDDVVAISGGDAAGIASYLRIIAKDGTIVAAAEAGLWVPGGKRAVATWRHQAATTKTREGGNSAAYRRAREARVEAERGARERGDLTVRTQSDVIMREHEQQANTQGVPMNELSTLAKAAEALSVHPQSLRRWGKTGAITLVRMPGGDLRVPNSEITRLATRRAYGAQTERA